MNRTIHILQAIKYNVTFFIARDFGVGGPKIDCHYRLSLEEKSVWVSYHGFITSARLFIKGPTAYLAEKHFI